MDRLIRQILNMVLRRGARHLMQQASKGGQGGKPSGQAGPDAQRQSAKRAQQALRLGRKIGRL